MYVGKETKMLEENESAEGAEMEAVIVPDGSAAPEVGPRPPWFDTRNNLAGDAELAKWAQGWIRNARDRFARQGERTQYRKDAKATDNMYRMGLNRETSSTQYSNTRSQVASSAIYRTVRSLVGMETSVFLGQDELPVEFIPEINNTEYDPTVAQAMADQDNMLEQHTWDEDNRRTNIRNILLSKEIGGQSLISMEWDRVIEENTERRPIEYDDNGQPTKYDWITAKRVTKDCPTVIEHPMERAYFDATIDNTPGKGMDDHQCVIVQQDKTLIDLFAKQEAGDFMNCDKLDPSMFYKDASTESAEDEAARKMNAGESTTVEANGTITVWQVEAIMPIKEFKKKGKPTGKGKLDLKERPKRYLLTFAGPSLDDHCVCLRIVRQPYFDNRSMFKLVHAMPDRKGAYHMWFAQMLQSLHWQLVTVTNQYFDNVDLRMKAPWTVDGRVESGLGKFRANALIKLARGVTLKQLDTSDTTQMTIQMLDRVEKEITQTAGTEKAGLGEPIGGRASATEAKQLLDQSITILDEKLAYVADDMFPWIAINDAMLWRRFADPARVARITQNNKIVEIRPGTMWGPIKTRVTAVSRFKNTIQARQEANSLIQNMWDKIAPLAGEAGMKILAREILTLFRIKNVNDIIPSTGDYEARKAAMFEAMAIYNEKKLVPPEPDENHQVHLSVLEPMYAEFKALPQADRDPEVDALFQEAIQIRRNMMEAQKKNASGQPQLQAPEGGQPAQPTLPGEMMGDQIAAEEGGAA